MIKYFFVFQRRHALLEDSIRLFGFYRECDDFEKWIKDKEKMLRTDDKADSVETAKRKYEVGTIYIYIYKILRLKFSICLKY